MTELLDHRPWLVLAAALVALGYLGWRVFKCWFWPYLPCVRCDGKARFRAPFSRAWRNCPRCEGRGRRIRPGRKLLGRLGVSLPPE